MPTNTSLTINSTQDGKKVTDKISYVNPNITDKQARLLAQTFNALSQNAYVSTDRTDTTNLDSIPKASRTFSAMRITNSNYSVQKNITPTVDNVYNINLTLAQVPQGSPQLTLWIQSNAFMQLDICPQTIVETNNASIQSLNWRTPQNSAGFSNAWLVAFQFNEYIAQSGTIKLVFPENDTYEETAMTFNITITEE